MRTAVMLVVLVVAIAFMGFRGWAWFAAPCEDYTTAWYLRYLDTPGRCS